MTTLFDNFYQMGFVARDLDRAVEALGRRHGVTRWRRKASSPWMDAAHAWAGGVMLEVIAVRPGGPDIYDAAIPDDPAAVCLHHHGFRVPDGDSWAAVNRMVEAGGWAVPMRGAVMDGQLNYLYADTRTTTGLYSEYVWLNGDATRIYDDVPHN